jgi:hypothetical protein
MNAARGFQGDGPVLYLRAWVADFRDASRAENERQLAIRKPLEPELGDLSRRLWEPVAPG